MTHQPADDTVEETQAPQPNPGEDASEPKTDEVATPEQEKRPSRGRDAVFVVVVAAVVLVGVYYNPEIAAFIKLQPWSKAGPRTAVQQFAEALRADDADAVSGKLTAEFEVRAEGGKIVALVQNIVGPQQPVFDAASVTPSGSVAEAGVRYVYDAIKWGAFLKTSSAAGGSVEFKLQPVEDTWKIVDLQPSGAAE